MTSVAVLGAGAWGTAFAVHLARSAHMRPTVTLWARDALLIGELARAGINSRYLPGIRLPTELQLTDDLTQAAQADLLVAATPVAALPALANLLAGSVANMLANSGADAQANAAPSAAAIAMRGPGSKRAAHAPLFWLSKGLVADALAPGGYALPHQILAALWPAPVGVASGPTFADEVARGLPAALTIAATDAAAASMFAAMVRSDALRAYESDDLAGVEIGAATKNVLAIAAGISDGLGYGHNARAALITRGLAETGRLSAALGGRRDTLMGLAGLGDLVLTCTGDLSRNRRVGLELAAGKSLAGILASLGHVAEGVSAARAVTALASHHDVDMPICTAVAQVLDGETSPQLAVEALLRREPKSERH